MQKGRKQREPRGRSDRNKKQPMHPMTKIVQWNCKGLRAKYEDLGRRRNPKNLETHYNNSLAKAGKKPTPPRDKACSHKRGTAL